MKLIKMTKIEDGTLEDALSRIEIYYRAEQDTLENIIDNFYGDVDIKEIFKSVKDWNVDYYIDDDIIDDLMKFLEVDNEAEFEIWDASGNKLYEN